MSYQALYRKYRPSTLKDVLGQDVVIKILENAKILYKCDTFDIKSKEVLKGERKYYLADLSFRFDKDSSKLYINVSNGTPGKITIEYIPIIHSVEEIKSPYWIDMLMRLTVALTKVTVGRIRTRYTQSNALWQGDGDTILSEGRDELNNLREALLQNSELCYPID